jgi:hypothetical protein
MEGDRVTLTNNESINTNDASDVTIGKGPLFIRGLNAASIVGIFVFNAFAIMLPLNGRTPAMVSADYPTWVTPAGYAFSIWSNILHILHRCLLMTRV